MKLYYITCPLYEMISRYKNFKKVFQYRKIISGFYSNKILYANSANYCLKKKFFFEITLITVSI